MEERLDKLKEIVFEQKKRINTREVARLFNIHISQAQRLLATFAKQYKQQSLDVYYVLNGYKHTEGDEVKIQRFMLVEEDDVEEEKRYFTEITGCMIKAVQIKSEDELETFIAPESDKIDLAKQIENLTFIQTDLTYREKYLKHFHFLHGKTSDIPLTHVNSDSNSTSSCSQKSDVKQEEKKTIPTKKGQLTFSKIDKKEFDEQRQKQNVQLKKDASLVKEEEQLQEQMDVSEPIEFKSEKVKSTFTTLKRSSDSVDSDDEDFLTTKKENKKRNGKPWKRIRPLADSDDDLVDKNDAQRKKEESCDSGKKETAAGSQQMARMVTETEEYVDDQGYTVTRQVNRVVKLTESPCVTKLPKEEKTPLTKKSDNHSPEQQHKALPKKTSKVAASQKGQTRITSFFTKQ